MDEAARSFLAEHAERFNTAVEDGNFGPLVELFADDAVLEFVGVPAGLFAGRDAIAAAYAAQPPDDALDVLAVSEDPDGTFVEPFAWRRGGTGTMRVTLANRAIKRLVVAFD